MQACAVVTVLGTGFSRYLCFQNHCIYRVVLPGNLHFQSTTFLCLCEVTIPCNAFHMVKES